jgi:type IX secretion system PorP/SprF family membrane protein
MKHLLTTLVILFSFAAQAQFNPLQTQYVSNPLVINPACAGEQGYMSATFSARKQWLGFNGAPETFVFTAHTPVKNLHHNIGLLAAQDNIAVTHRTEVRVVYAYRILTRSVNFSAGISPGIELVRNNWNEVITNTSGDAAFASAERFSRFAIHYGLYLNAKHFFVGASGRAVMNASISDQPLQLFGGVRWGDAERVQLTVSTLGRMMMNGFYQADVNVNCLLRNRIGIGFGYRHKDAVTGILQVKLNDQLTIGYAYDYTTSSLQRYSSGSHEMLLRYDFGYVVQRSSPR